MDEFENGIGQSEEHEESYQPQEQVTEEVTEAAEEAVREEPEEAPEPIRPASGTAYADPYFNVPPVLADAAALDKEAFWKNIAAEGRKRRRHKISPLIIILAVLLLIIAAVTLITIINGKGWLLRALNGGKSIDFTLPAANKPISSESAYQADGRYTVEGVAEALMPSIVKIQIYTSKTAIMPSSQGSGIIASEDGYIVTNAHVVDEAEKIKVHLNTGEEYAADIVGSDPTADIAVVEIGQKGLTPATFGNSDEAKLGEDVVVIGSPAGFYGSVTKGIVSGIDRLIKVESFSIPMKCLQVDAAINPGNSGGALVNMWGQVVGIVSSKLASRTYYGIGFAITINAAKPIIEDIIARGYVAEWPKIGITFYTISKEYAESAGVKPGLYIVEIDPECDIANSGLQVGDIITFMDGKARTTTDDVREMLKAHSPGDVIDAKVYRPEAENKGTEFEISYVLAADSPSFVQKTE